MKTSNHQERSFPKLIRKHLHFRNEIFFKILIKTRISYIFTSTNVRVDDVHVVYVNWCRVQTALFFIPFLLFFSSFEWSCEKWPRQWKRATCHDTWELFCFFLSHYYFGKDERQIISGFIVQHDIFIPSFSFWWNCPHTNGKKIFKKWIWAIFLLQCEASNLNDSLLILIYRSFHF